MKKMLLLSALSGGLIAAAACAQSQPTPTAPAGGHAAHGDTDGDGAISRAEFVSRADRQFAKRDLNHDGKLTSDEMSAPDQGGPDAGQQRRGGSRWLSRADANGDGIITPDEFRAMSARRFDRMDANHDGRIDAGERDAMRQRRMQRTGEMDGAQPAPNGDQ